MARPSRSSASKIGGAETTILPATCGRRVIGRRSRRTSRSAVVLVASLAVLAACSDGGDSEQAVETTQPATTTTATTAPPTTAAPTSTTTVAPEPGDARGPGVVGFVGCSVTRDAVQGYHIGGGTRMWFARGISYGGGSIGRWSRAIGTPSGLWRDFTTLLADNPGTATIWVQLCTSRSSPEDSYDAAVRVIDELQERVPGASVYLSAQPAYDGHDCGIAGPTGPQDMQAIVDQLVADGIGLPGPVVGPLEQGETVDGCHGNEPGMQLMGDQLAEFFGSEASDGATADQPGG
jgi:hypothetical protein